MIEKIYKDMSKYLPAQLVPGLVGFMGVPIITRLFEPAEFGKYILVITTVRVLTIIASWLSLSVVRFYPIYERDGRLNIFYTSILKIFILVVALISFVSVLLIISIKSFISFEVYKLMWFGLPLFVLGALYELLLEFFRGKRKINLFRNFKIWRSIMTLGFGILFVIVFSFGIEGLIIGGITSILLALPFLYRFAVESEFRLRLNVSKEIFSELSKFGIPLVFGNIAAWILSLSDRYLLEFFRNSLEVGIYSACYGISEYSIILISALFALTSGSLIFKIYENDGEEKCRTFIHTITRYFLLICIPAVVGLSVLSKPLIHLMTSEAYHEGYKIVPVVTMGAFFLGLQQLYHAGFRIRKKTNFIAIGIIISGLFNIGFNLFLIPKFGYIAAAFMTLFSYIFLFVIIVFFSKRYFIWPFPHKSLIRALIAAIIMGITLYYLIEMSQLTNILTLILSVIIGTVEYLLLIVLLREVLPEEKVVIKKMAQKFFF